MKKLILISLVIFLAICSRSWAEEYYLDDPLAPNYFRVANQDLNINLAIECMRTDNKKIIDCIVKKTSISPITTLSDDDLEPVAKKLWDRKLSREYDHVKDCHFSQKIYQLILQDNAFNEKIERALRNINALSEEDIIDIIKSAGVTCNLHIKSYEDFLKILKYVTLRQRKTCEIDSFTFPKDRYEARDDDQWVHLTEVVDPECGVMRMYRIQKNHRWHLYVRNIISKQNIDEESGKNMCSKYNENEIKFSGDINHIPVDCDYIKFNSF